MPPRGSLALVFGRTPWSESGFRGAGGSAPRHDASTAEWRPVQLVDIELSAPLRTRARADAERYETVQALVRLHGRPLGLVTLPVQASPHEQAQAVSRALGSCVADHLADDGLDAADRVPAAGLPPYGSPRCAERRRALLQSPPAVTVLVATRDRTPELGACLDSLLRQDYPGSYDIVVTDSAPSSDATRDYLHARFDGDPRVHYVRAERPGLAVAHNHGLEAATGEVIAITDDDVVADVQWLSALVQAFREFPGTACVTGLILPFELETRAQALLEQYGGFSRGFERRVYSLGSDRPDDPLFPYTAGRLGSGANMAFEASALRALRGFDPALGAGTPARGGDDLAAFAQVLLAGHRLVYQPEAVVRHRHRRDFDGLRAMAKGYGIGLGAYLASTVARRPSALVDVLLKARGVPSYLLRADSPKNRGKGREYPRELDRVERLGMVRGPAAYIQSRWTSR
jgi:GT2 family glycosyltransferase